MKFVKDEFAFPRFLKFWRGVFKVSQEELAFQLGCSPRHVSRLETGECRPSETLIQQVADTLGLGKRDHNHLRIAAGFAPDEPGLDFNSREMNWLRKAMLRTLRALDPLPATLLDSRSNILMVNRGFVSLFTQQVSEELLAKLDNNFDFVFANADPEHEEGRADTLSAILMASQQAALFSNNAEDLQHIVEMEKHPAVPSDWKQRAAGMEPMASFRVQLKVNGQEENFFNVSTTVGALGPAAFLSEPRLTINILYPEDEDLDLTAVLREDARHPLLFY
ncbi:helix-turn-helix transcriptional regulator [Spongiibacter sp. KMU-166]|uniref:Helix-turn-helix transcriptional regulator n=1 Tax=Spongiibacter thalassae TaxID=2721624 RepID=A0ABX1GEH9_9GAMM|nr:helix-turn-helix transcriptional regulator [Spongiibacter thalassae]NKI16882.1 helix-turn-helix transcriptional regulator [Spongiibacter thalassae]